MISSSCILDHRPYGLRVSYRDDKNYAWPALQASFRERDKSANGIKIIEDDILFSFLCFTFEACYLYAGSQEN